MVESERVVYLGRYSALRSGDGMLAPWLFPAVQAMALWLWKSDNEYYVVATAVWLAWATSVWLDGTCDGAECGAAGGALALCPSHLDGPPPATCAACTSMAQWLDVAFVVTTVTSIVSTL